MARRSRDDILLLGLSLLLYNRAGAGLRLRRNCWLGLSTHFKFGSGVGLWWSALALVSTPHHARRYLVDY
eukprot:3771435-Pyramimonas_sp.AAC.1